MLNIAPDKWKHFWVGIPMGFILQAVAWYLYPPLMYLLAFAAVCAISYGFELISLVTGKGHYEIRDAIASIIGGACGMGCFALLLLI
jgi:hypothetical protein